MNKRYTRPDSDLISDVALSWHRHDRLCDRLAMYRQSLRVYYGNSGC